MYRIFDIPFQCSFKLPELVSMPEDATRFKVQMGQQGDTDFSKFRSIFEWHDETGRLVCSSEYDGEDFLIRFPHHAFFHISSTDLISCFPEPGSSTKMLRHLLLNQGIPRYLSSKGHWLLHASALTLPSGRSVAFVGRSGYGKSTLASVFFLQGARLISDDCVLIHQQTDSVTAIGGLHGMRLRNDSMAALFKQTGKFSDYSPYSDKKQMLITDENTGGFPNSCELDVIYLINDPHREPANTVGFNQIPSSAALMALLHTSISLNPDDPLTKGQTFDQAASLLNSGLAFCEVAYPRNFDDLPLLTGIITDHANSLN